MKIPRFIAVSAAVMLMAAMPLCAEGKVRIAVMDFDTEALRNSWHYGWSWSNLSTAAADTLVTELVKSGKFSVIEREKLNLVLQEHQLSASGAVSSKTAVELGKLLGVQLIVTGSVSEFGVSEMGGHVPQIGKWKWGSGVGGKMFRGKSTVNARLIDTTTAEILNAYEASGDQKFGSAEFAGADLGKQWDSGIASKVLAESMRKLADGIAADSANIVPSTGVPGVPFEGKVAAVKAGAVYINQGADSGLKIGDKLAVFRAGEEIRDPETNEVLDVEIEEIGALEVTEVRDKVTLAKIVKGAGFKAGDIVRRS
jgi:curli biogenesis system outer membrane secretion channel CsgG